MMGALQIEMVVDGRKVGYNFHCAGDSKIVIFRGWPAEPGAS
jgi:hypothetical protein